jgi:hypothetical protein
MAVTPATIATALGVAAPDSGSAQFAQWSMWIADALMLINARKVALAIETDLDATVLDYVVREAVTVMARRPDDATQVSVSIDDGSVSKTFRSGSGRVSILDEWWALLGLTAPNGGAFSVDTVAAASIHQPWCNLAFGALYCSCGADLAGFPLWED